MYICYNEAVFVFISPYDLIGTLLIRPFMGNIMLSQLQTLPPLRCRIIKSSMQMHHGVIASPVTNGNFRVSHISTISLGYQWRWQLKIMCCNAKILKIVNLGLQGEGYSELILVLDTASSLCIYPYVPNSCKYIICASDMVLFAGKFRVTQRLLLSKGDMIINISCPL